VNCHELRDPLTVGKENFIEDLRIRVLNNDEENESNSEKHKKHLETVKTINKDLFLIQNEKIIQHEKWTLEIRKFSKNDEGCYQCALNSKNEFIYHCVYIESNISSFYFYLDSISKTRCQVIDLVVSSALASKL
jgi:hypothetical protein